MTAPVDLTAAPRPVRPWASRPAAPDQFLELQRRMKAAGLLDPRPGYYAAKITFNLLLLAAGWTALALVGNSWWVIAVGAYMAFAYTQTGFIGHDIGHRQVTRNRRRQDLLGLRDRGEPDRRASHRLLRRDLLAAARGEGHRVHRDDELAVRPVHRLGVRPQPQGHADPDARRGVGLADAAGGDLAQHPVVVPDRLPLRRAELPEIEHHLFPAMPRKALRRARPITIEYCHQIGLPYHEVGAFRSYAEVVIHLYRTTKAYQRTLTVAA